MTIFCSQWSTAPRRKTLVAVWPALKLAGAHAANAGWSITDSIGDRGGDYDHDDDNDDDYI